MARSDSDEIRLLVPKELASTGSGVLAFNIELDGNPYRDWTRKGRLEEVTACGGCKTAGEFNSRGILSLSIPGDLSGEITPVLEFVHPRDGSRLVGCFCLKINRIINNVIHVQTGEHKLEGDAVHYNPVEIHGGSSVRTETVGDKVRATIKLGRERPESGIPLDDIIEKEGFVRLNDRGDGILRVLQIHVGRTLVMGRCYTSQINPEARRKLDALAQRRVHWITNWDDARINQVSAQLRYSAAGGQDRLEITNLTDYSRYGHAIVVEGESVEPFKIPPGDTGAVSVANEGPLSLLMGEGTGRALLARIDFENVPLDQEAGAVAVPVFRTDRSTFRFPPDGGAEAASVHFLGVWIPQDPRTLQKNLTHDPEMTLTLVFPHDEVTLFLGYDPHRRLVCVSSNEMLYL